MSFETKFGKGTYFLGDICYALREDIYDNDWGTKHKYKDGAYEGYAVGGTAYGDGCYADTTDSYLFCVDAGVLGVVDLKYAEPNVDLDRLNDLGKVVGVRNTLIFVYDDGVFEYNVDGEFITVDTTDYGD